MGSRMFMDERAQFDNWIFYEFDSGKEEMKSEDSAPVRAAMVDNLTELKNLAEQGHDLNAKFEGGYLLHIAVAYRSRSIVEHFFDVFTVNVERKNFQGWTALFIAAAFTRDLSLVRRLLDAGAKPNTTSYEGVKLLDYILNWAPNLTEEHAAITRLLMEAADVDSLTSLHLAVLTDLRLTSTLIEAGVDVNERSFGGNTPLHVAVAHGKVECVQLLLEAKADVNQKNKYGFTPIHLCLEADESLLKLLLENGADLDLEDLEGQTVVHHAVFKDKADNLARILKAGANVEPRDKIGCTPLHLAAEACLPNCVEVGQVLIKAGADVNATNDDGDTPLLHACCCLQNNLEIVAMLLYHDADQSMANNYGRTPFVASLRGKSLDTQELLFLYETNFDQIDYWGNSVLGMALCYESPLLPKLVSVGAVLRISVKELAFLFHKPGMFQKLWRMIDHETFTWGEYDSVLMYSVGHQDNNLFSCVMMSEELPDVLDEMYKLRTQHLLRYGSLSRFRGATEGLINFALEQFDKETACEYVYILLSHGYHPDYREAESVFGVFGQSRLFSLFTELDLQPCPMLNNYLLPTVMFDVSRSVDEHISDFIQCKIGQSDSFIRPKLNLETIAGFFAGKFSVKLQRSYNTSARGIYGTIDLQMGMIQMLGHALPSLRELCRDCIRDAVCIRQKVRTYGVYRRTIALMASGIYREALTLKLPLYSVDKRKIDSFCDRLNALP